MAGFGSCCRQTVDRSDKLLQTRTPPSANLCPRSTTSIAERLPLPRLRSFPNGGSSVPITLLRGEVIVAEQKAAIGVVAGVEIDPDELTATVPAG
jgi:hypothetical protein